MIADDTSDLVVRSLGGLAMLTPDQRRAALVRERCRAQLQRRTPKHGNVLGPVLFTGLCVIYLSALVLDVLRLGRML